MGTYLSTPVLDKCCEDGEKLEGTDTPVVWGVVDMQGWRKSMEDAHIAQTNVTPPDDTRSKNPTKVFAIFDGHGGAEVARFCQLYLVDVLTNQSQWKGDKVDVGSALVNSFHNMDRMIDDPDRREEIARLRTEKPKQGESRTVTTKDLKKVEDQSDVDEKKIEASDHKDGKKAENMSRKDDEEKTEDDSDDIAGEIQADERLDDEGDDTINETPPGLSSDDAMSLFKKLLKVSGASSIVGTEDENAKSVENGKAKLASEKNGASGKSAIQPTIIQNGRQVCNLPDHPVHAGCTSICAVIVDKTLTVANAGDSRGVLCRKEGVTSPLSFDHKPSQDREMKRITGAGGFVNQFGRVNGNLNLSRSIGDMKYKQVPGIPPYGQMITAEPDITQVILEIDDEFIILACDGIWDCLSNEEAVKYVYDRIDAKSTIDIGIEMLDEIVSKDPRVSQGIGGDNMTVMIIDLQPQNRSHRLNKDDGNVQDSNLGNSTDENA